MKASEARKILNCSYSSLHNYIQNGKLKVVKEGNKHPDYINESVYELAEKINGYRKNAETISIYMSNRKYEFKLPKDMTSRVLDFVNTELKKELKDDNQ